MLQENRPNKKKTKGNPGSQQKLMFFLDGRCVSFPLFQLGGDFSGCLVVRISGGNICWGRITTLPVRTATGIITINSLGGNAVMPFHLQPVTIIYWEGQPKPHI